MERAQKNAPEAGAEELPVRLVFDPEGPSQEEAALRCLLRLREEAG